MPTIALMAIALIAKEHAACQRLPDAGAGTKGAGPVFIEKDGGNGKMRYRGALAMAFAIAATASVAAPEQDPSAVGRWLIENGKAAVDIYPCGGDKLCGRVAWLERPYGRNGRPLTDQHNPSPALQSRPICGMVTMGGFTRTGRNSWGDGWAYDPESGNTYNAEMTLESPNVLKLRGYVGMPLFGVTRTWTRAATLLASCRTPAS